MFPCVSFIIIIIIYPLTVRVVWAPKMILRPVFSIFSCSPLPSGTCRTPGLSIPWCCLPTFSSVCLVFFPLSVCLARWFWPDQMNGKHDHTTEVCGSLRSSGGLRVVQLPAGSCYGLPHWLHGLCMRCVVSCGSTSFLWLVYVFGALLCRVHDSQAYRKMDVTRERISRILGLTEKLLSI